MTPAISCDFASISAFRSAGPAIRDPNTIRAFSRVCSFCVFGSDPVGGGLGAVRVKGCTFDIGLDMISSKDVNVLKKVTTYAVRTCVEARYRVCLVAGVGIAFVGFGAPLYPVAVL